MEGKESRTGSMISVIVTVYDRTEFFGEALDSLENQTLDKTKFEVIIVTNSQLKISKQYSFKCKIHMSQETRLAPKLLEGIRLSKGDLITFLEDDDLYLPDRLERILEVFSKNTELILYHNRSLNFKNDESKILVKSSRKNGKSPKRFLVFSRKDNKLILGFKPDYNTSSQAINILRLSVYVEFLSSLGNKYIDAFFFFSALDSGSPIFIDEHIGTLRRVHKRNASMFGSLKSNGQLSNDLFEIRNFGLSVGIINDLNFRCFLKKTELDELMASGSLSRKECFRRYIEILKVYRNPLKDVIISIKAVSCLTFPVLLGALIKVFYSQ